MNIPIEVYEPLLFLISPDQSTIKGANFWIKLTNKTKSSDYYSKRLKQHYKMRKTSFAAAAIAAIAASVKACDMPNQDNEDFIELMLQNFRYVAECNDEADHIKFAQFYRRFPDFTEEKLSYDQVLTTFLNYDLNGDGRLTRLEVLNRARAMALLGRYDNLVNFERPYLDISDDLFKMMDEKYIYDRDTGYELVNDGQVDRESFKAFAPEYLKKDRVREQEITREMRVRDYDYIYERDPKAMLARYDESELIAHNEYYTGVKEVWD